MYAERSAFVVAGSSLAKNWPAQEEIRVQLGEKEMQPCSKIKVMGVEYADNRRLKK